MGVVTTTTVQHASPAGTYAHTVNRNWYSDSDMPASALQEGCQDIATQLISNMDIDVSSKARGVVSSKGRTGLARVQASNCLNPAACLGLLGKMESRRYSPGPSTDLMGSWGLPVRGGSRPSAPRPPAQVL